MNRRQPARDAGRRPARRRIVRGAASTALLAALFAGLAFPGARPAAAAPLTFDNREDIGAMLAEARAAWNFDDQDAVLLTEGARFTWLAGGRLREERHRVVWIGTEFAIRTYADLRVPWDSDRQTLTVKALRVWRDNRWIEHRPTAIVETTPFAFRNAPDYTGIRETMLLHDGVELPCILECDYVIEDKVAYRPGFDGQWIFARGDPALESRIVIDAPADAGLKVQVTPGAESIANAAPDAPAGSSVHAWRMRKVEPEPSPATGYPASYLPHLTWSTYASLEDLGRRITAAWSNNLTLDAALKDSVRTMREAAFSRRDLARRVTDFVSRSQRHVVYDPQYMWARVRPAARTFDTGYGADFDLTVLAGALLKESGLEPAAVPVFLARGSSVLQEPPTLAAYDLRGVLLPDSQGGLFCDVAHGTLESGLWNRGLPVWAPGLKSVGPQPVGVTGYGEPGGRSAIALDLRWNKGQGKWCGEGVLEAAGLLDPLAVSEMTARDTGDQFEDLAGAVVDSFTVVDFSFSRPADNSSSVFFRGQAPAGARDDQGRLPLLMGEPAGGLSASLPADIHLDQARRGTPVQLPGPLEQSVTLRLHTASLEVVRLPEPVAITNAAGSFRLAVERKENLVTITRATTLKKSTYAPEEWPALRALLLAEQAAANRTLLFQ